MSGATKLVAVCGATGKQGGATLAALLRLGGFRVRALTRNPSSPASVKLAGPEVELVKADFEDKDSLMAAFQGCDAVFGVTDFWVACQGDPEREKKQGMNIVDAAKAAGVKHLVLSSLEDTRPALTGVRPALIGDYTVPHFDAKAEVDAYMRQQLPGSCTSLITSVFYENFLPSGGMQPRPGPDGAFTVFIPTGQAKLSWCSTDDIGAVAAAVIAAGPEQYGDKVVPVAGEHASVAEVADTFTRVFGKEVKAATGVTPDQWAQAVAGQMPEGVAQDLASMWFFYTVKDMCQLRPLEQTAALHPRVQSLEAWLNQHKEELAPGFA